MSLTPEQLFEAATDDGMVVDEHHSDGHDPVSNLTVVPAPGADRTTRVPHCLSPGCRAPQTVVHVGSHRGGIEADTVVGHLEDDLPPWSRTTTDSAAARACRRVLRTASCATRHTSATVSRVALGRR